MEKVTEPKGVIDREGTLDLDEFLRQSGPLLLRALAGGIVGGLLGLLSAFFLPTTYKSEAFVEVFANPIQKILDAREDPDVVGVKSDPTFQVKTVEILAGTQNIINSVTSRLHEMGLNDPVEYSAKSISNTRLVGLRVKSRNAQESIQAVNLWAETVIDVISQQRAEGFQKGDALLGGPYLKLSHETESLHSQIKKMNPQRAIEEAELESLQALVIGQIKELMLIDPAIAQNTFTLPVLKAEIKKHERILPNGSMEKGSHDAPLDGLSLDRGPGVKVVGIITYGANPLYLELQKKISDMEVAQETLVSRRDQLNRGIRENKILIETLSRSVIKTSETLNRLERDYGVAKKSFDAIYSNIGETKLSGSLPMANIRIASHAVIPDAVRKGKGYVANFFLLGFLGSFLFFYLRMMSGTDPHRPARGGSHDPL